MNSEVEKTPSQQSICNYIEDIHTSGALLVCGEWRSGKTHFLKQMAEEYNKSDYAVAHISLFGLSSSNEIEEAIKKEICYVFAEPKGTEEDKNVTGKLFKGLKTLTGHFKENNKIINAVDVLINFNYMDFIDLNDNILGKKIVLIFDDFERCIIASNLLLGIINEYCENLHIKVIIVANEAEITDKNAYDEYKEKVIYKTVKLKQNIPYVLEVLISEFNGNDSRYQRYLVEHTQLILDVFNQSGYNNYRSLRTAINDFEKIFLLFIKKITFTDYNEFNEYEKKALSLLAEQFFAFTFESCANNNIYHYFYELFTTPIATSDDNELEYIPYSEESLPVFVHKYRQELFDIYNAPKAIVEWITNGIYEEESISKCIDEYIEKFKPHNYSEFEKFMSTHILALDNIEIFNTGYLEAIKKAKSGELTSEQYLTLLYQIHQAKKLKLSLPEDPDYSTIAAGFESIDRTDEEEPVLGGFSGPVERVANNLKKKIDDTIQKRPANRKANEYYKYCLTYFNSCNVDPTKYFSHSQQIEIKLTNDLITSVISAFKNANNKKRREIASNFLGIKFSNYKDKVLINNFVQLLELLRNGDITDPIGLANLDDFIESAKQRFLLNYDGAHN